MGRGKPGAPRSPGAGTTIEFLAPNDAAFGPMGGPAGGDDQRRPDAASGFDDDERAPSRWSSLGAAIGVVALLAVGVISAAPWSSDRATAPPPTTLPPAATVAPATPNPTDTDREAQTAGYVPVDLPARFAPSGLYTTSPADAKGWLELWAAPRSARLSGSWFALQLTPGHRSHFVQDATVVMVGARPAIWYTTADGVSVLEFRIGENVEATLTSFGWSIDDLVELAASIGLIDQRPLYGDIGFQGEHLLLIARPSTTTVLEQEYVAGLAESFVEYRREYDGATIDVTVGKLMTDRHTLARFVLAPSGDLFLSRPDVRRNIGRINATAGITPGLHDRSVVQWSDGDSDITVTSDLPLIELLDVATSARPASAEVWAAVADELRAANRSGPRQPYLVGRGELADKTGWNVAFDPFGGYLSFGHFSGSFLYEVPLDTANAPIATYTGLDATIVVARTAYDDPSTLLRVVFADGTVVEAPLVDVGRDRMAAVASMPSAPVEISVVAEPVAESVGDSVTG